MLAWRLPAIAEAPAGGFIELEEACYLVENLLFLCGWVNDLTCLATLHERFRSRVRRSKQPMPGCRPMTLSEAQHALGLVQSQWAKASRNSDKLDDVILNTLPPDTDELDARLALASRQTSQTAAFPGPRAEHHLARTPAIGDAGAPSPFAAPDEPSGPAAKRRRLSKAQ